MVHSCVKRPSRVVLKLKENLRHFQTSNQDLPVTWLLEGSLAQTLLHTFSCGHLNSNFQVYPKYSKEQSSPSVKQSNNCDNARTIWVSYLSSSSAAVVHCSCNKWTIRECMESMIVIDLVCAGSSVSAEDFCRPFTEQKLYQQTHRKSCWPPPCTNIYIQLLQLLWSLLSNDVATK